MEGVCVIKTVNEQAYAKVNLFLDVVSRRDDGFHNVKTVMHSVSLADDLTVSAELSEKNFITLDILGADLPADDNNLVMRACRAYLDKAGLSATVSIQLIKNIPIAAGLAGGSSDAAATLRALNAIFLRFDEEGLCRLGLEIGSDVPFCLVGKTALCEGRGELITKMPDCEKMYFAIAKGSERVSTPEAYRTLDGQYSNFDGSVKTGGEALYPLFERDYLHSVISPEHTFNIFEESSKDRIKSVAELKKQMSSYGATLSLMSGSGPSVFGIFRTSSEARAAVAALSDIGYAAFYAESVI